MQKDKILSNIQKIIVSLRATHWAWSQNNKLELIVKKQLAWKFMLKNKILSDINKNLYAFAPFSGHGHKQPIRINYIARISIKSDAKKRNYYQISKKLLQAFSQFSGHDNKTTN